MVKTYFEIGRLIVENEQNGKNRAEYGKETLKNLSERLTKDFGKGFYTTVLEKQAKDWAYCQMLRNGTSLKECNFYGGKHLWIQIL